MLLKHPEFLETKETPEMLQKIIATKEVTSLFTNLMALFIDGEKGNNHFI